MKALLHFSNVGSPGGDILTVTCDYNGEKKSVRLSIGDMRWTQYGREEVVKAIPYLGLPMNEAAAMAVATGVKCFLSSADRRPFPEQSFGIDAEIGEGPQT